MRLLLILALVWLFDTCQSGAPEVSSDVEWTTWTNVAAGYLLEVPEPGD